MSHEPQDVAPELHEVAHALEQHRPRMTGPELARVRGRIDAGGSRTSPARRGGFMRSRMAIVAMLAAGGLLFTSGAALGVSALSTTTSAGEAQYGTGDTSPSDTSDDTLAGTPSGSDVKSGSSEEGSSPSSSATPTATAQKARQLENASGVELPFTGYAAIPLLLVGLLLLGAGLLIRRGTGRAPAGA